MTAKRDYLTSLLAAFLLHALVLALLGRGLPGRDAYTVPGAPAPPLTMSLLPPRALSAPPAAAVRPAPAPSPAEAPPAPAPAVDAAAQSAPLPAAGARAGPARPEQLRTRAPGRPAFPERVKPRLTAALSPAFPLGSRRRGEEGDVRLKVFLTAAGRVSEVLLLDSSGFAALDRSALRAARRGSFSPALVNGRPADGELVIRVRFRLEES